MKILITGHKGFCGRHFVQALTGHEIVGVDLKEGNDCRDFFKTDNRVFDLVVHLAAIVGGREKIEQEPLAVATDLSIDAEMFNWAIRTGQKKIVYYSSSAAYPINLQNQPYKLKETDIDLREIKNPDFTYGWAKLTGEMLAGFARRQGINVYVFRPFSGYGEDQDETYPFPALLKRIKERQNPFEIWGDGEQVRDFIHIDDIVQATLKIIDLDIQEPVNLGMGIPTSFNQLAELMFQLANFYPKIKYLPEKPVGVAYRCGDNRKMLKFYKPSITLRQVIAKALGNRE